MKEVRMELMKEEWEKVKEGRNEGRMEGRIN